MILIQDTIAAIATAPGHAGLAVIRISGPRSLALADAIFQGSRALAEAPSHTLHHGWARWPAAAVAPEGRSISGTAADPVANPRSSAVEAAEPVAGSPIDEVVAGIFRAPRSYTREDVVELSCHGGRLPARSVLAALLAAGARLAEPGEFTLRAFLNGRLDLAQAEAVADVIASETEAACTLALSQLAGDLSRRLDGLAERVTDALSEVEARVDFAEDVGGIEVPAHVIEAILAVDAGLCELLDGAAYARAVREGLRLAIIGRPNVGKSSLFNALLGEERAIVAATPGTTRDRVSEAIELAGVRIVLSDTAGLRETAEPIEAIGVERAHEALGESGFVLWVVDGSSPLQVEDRRIADRFAGKRVVVALNKRDLPSALELADLDPLLQRAALRSIVPVSALTGAGIEELRAGVIGLLDVDRAEGGLGAAVANPRHLDALNRGRAALERAAAAARLEAPGEIVALELRESLAAIGEVTGKTLGEDLLDRIFSRFCVGK